MQSSAITFNYYVQLVNASNKFQVQVYITPFNNIGSSDYIGLYESEADLRSDIELAANGKEPESEATWKDVKDFDMMGDGGISWTTDEDANNGWIAAYFAWNYLWDKWVFVARSPRYGARRILHQFEHIVVLMDENRSIDNLLGYLYENDSPKYNIPAQTMPTFNGLQAGGYFNQYDPSDPNSPRVYASKGTSGNSVPTPDPGEEFVQMTQQIFGVGTKADMSGFLMDYAAITSASPDQIMTSYSPDQVPVISKLARAFAVSDAWQAAAPCQTWPNRGFMHTGSSDGQINNTADLYDINTIFNLLEEQGITWEVYTNDPAKFCLTRDVFPKLYLYGDHFHKMDEFFTAVAEKADAPMYKKLPAYTFLEPLMFTSGDQSYHPPHDVQPGEQYLAGVYNAIRKSPYRDKILFILVFDEHGGCYDHVPPPDHAQQPEPWPVSRDGSFNFERWGVRVPAIFVSSYTDEGGVIRSNTGVPFDHTSILATLRDWCGFDEDNFQVYLPSPRITAAPTLTSVVTRSEPRTDWPDIQPAPRPAIPTDPNRPAQEAALWSCIFAESYRKKRALTEAEEAELRARIRTDADAREFLYGSGPTSPAST